ncbi:MAG: hypothetical protein ACD_77C00504G0002 [uncultured bacterium]|nr:MAG: hypothetical protein ACD_77C00504G0002 [uncultured bacterium]
MEIIQKISIETLQIVLLVFTMMVLVDLINVWTRGKIKVFLAKGKKYRQYIIASFIGSLPGCVGGFTNVSLYIHGIISFGALTGALAAASGDEAFVMLAMFPKTAVFLIALLMVLGVLVGFMVDKTIKKLKIKTCIDCEDQQYHPNKKGVVHYLKEHIWGHIIKLHLWKTALWTFGALFVVEIGLTYFNLQSLSQEYPLTILLIAALMGLIPESGPHMIFVSLFASGLIPFSVLFTSAFVQDGHGMLPMLSYSVKDSIIIKSFNLIFGLSIGLIIYFIGY